MTDWERRAPQRLVATDDEMVKTTNMWSERLRDLFIAEGILPTGPVLLAMLNIVAVGAIRQIGMAREAFVHASELAYELARAVIAKSDQLPPHIAINDVIQLDPVRGCEWGPLFAIVDKVGPGWVRAYFFVPTERGQAPGHAPIRVENGNYVRIGRAEWLPQEGGRG